MSTIATSQIPPAIDTVERLASYSLLALARMNPDLRVLEVQGQSTKAIEVTVIPADDGTYRMVCRVSLPLDPDYATDTATPFYLKAQEFSNVAVPAGFLAA